MGCSAERREIARNFSGETIREQSIWNFIILEDGIKIGTK